MKRFLVLVALLAAGCSLPANPKTEITYGPFKFHDSKDNELELEGLEIDPATGTYKLQRGAIRNNASDVRLANVAQIQAYTEQVKAITAMVQDLGQVVRSLAPYAFPATSVDVNTPYGGGTVTRTPVLPPPAGVAPATTAPRPPVAPTTPAAPPGVAPPTTAPTADVDKTPATAPAAGVSSAPTTVPTVPGNR